MMMAKTKPTIERGVSNTPPELAELQVSRVLSKDWLFLQEQDESFIRWLAFQMLEQLI